MRLMKGYKIKVNNGREGIIKELDYKNGMRVVSFDGINGSQPGWCYKSQILQIYK